MNEYTSSDVAKANQIHQVIKLFRHFFPFEFEKVDIKWCEKCAGKGFINQPYSSGSRDFTGLGVVCEQCNGVGYYGYKYFQDGRVCTCNGVGCDRCEGKGNLDWVSAVMRKDKE